MEIQAYPEIKFNDEESIKLKKLLEKEKNNSLPHFKTSDQKIVSFFE